MKTIFAFVIIVLSLCLFTGAKQDSKPKKNFTVCISDDEMKLYNLLMEYRKTKGLPEIPFSKSLTYVARLHAKDIEDNSWKIGCNMHSWSEKGKSLWKYCCYTNDHKNSPCMWDKPRELTNYTGDGFEIAHGGRDGYVASPENALKGWKASKAHNPVIINEGKWADTRWNAIGVGIYKGYAMVWFGRETDPDGKPDVCK
ncbi:MAG: CAP domain-containing protein [Bacteroidia bacterium]|nr:CAP domain-containing protein [Bacteroidia bacterium]